MLQAENLTIELKSEKDEFFILRDFSIHLNKGEILGLAGESGSGINTAPIYKTGGNILVENKLLENDADYKSIRGKKISMIFQNPQSSLNPVMTIGRQLIETIMLHNKSLNKKQAKEIVAEKDTEILVINSGAVDGIMKENINVRCFLYELAMERFSTAMWTMQQILFEKMDRRLGTFLADECAHTGKSEIRMTQEEIAVQISSAREVVTRMLKRFAADGFIKLKRGAIIVKDCAALKNL